MFEDKNKDKLERIKETLEEFAEHMYMVSDGMGQFQKDLGIFAKELNMVKSYLEVMVKVLHRKGIVDKDELREAVNKNVQNKVRLIQENYVKQEREIKKEKEDMKHLIEKFKSSIGSWFDEDGNPIAKA